MALTGFDSGPSGFDEVIHYRHRFEEFQAMDNGRNALTNDLLGRLEALVSELQYVKSVTVANLEADLVDQKAGRRRWQSEVESLQRRLADMDDGRFVSVLIDADADIYYFSHDYVSRGLEGGQDAADKLMETIKEYLNTLTHQIQNLRNIQVLRLNMINPQCEHVLLACGHDGGYASFLSPYASRMSKKLTLISAGPGSLHPKMAALGFPSTELLKPLFTPSESPRVAEWAAKEKQPLAVQQDVPKVLPPPEQQLTSPKQPSTPPVKQGADTTQAKSWATKIQQSATPIQKEIVLDSSSKATSTKAYPYNPLKTDPKNHGMKFVANAGRLIPAFDDKGRRMRDKKLIIDRREDYELINEVKSRLICQWHYLRSDCTNHKCTRNHNSYPRPLSSREYDALWFLARLGKCNDMQKFGQCDDEYCIYGHDFDV
ncbi:hypothetical protein B2J93_9394 [Marssonina coronariae]|uniref:DUF7923 domain-containing protein n=1 Tax=Diplocarpon coronariae TaxID=2795749 RepID=A0A218ZAX4_9HELO|nr:hypothetical protein B2J93_9394 [Marssonina coronariae]